MSQNFEEIYRANVRGMMKVSYLYTKNREEAEEVVHEAFLKYMARTPDLDNPEEITRWLMRVAINICFDNKRKFFTKIKNLVNLNNYNEEYELNSLEVREDLKKILYKMGDKERMVLILKYALEMDYSEISKVMNQKEGTLKSMVSRILKKHRGKYE